MAGRAAMTSTSSAMSDISMAKKGDQGQGISGSQTSAIGGAGRMGGSAEGPDVARHCRVDEEFFGKKVNGNATGGNTGYNSGSGRTF